MRHPGILMAIACDRDRLISIHQEQGTEAQRVGVTPWSLNTSSELAFKPSTCWLLERKLGHTKPCRVKHTYRPFPLRRSSGFVRDPALVWKLVH